MQRSQTSLSAHNLRALASQEILNNTMEHDRQSHISSVYRINAPLNLSKLDRSGTKSQLSGKKSGRQLTIRGTEEKDAKSNYPNPQGRNLLTTKMEKLTNVERSSLDRLMPNVVMSNQKTLAKINEQDEYSLYSKHRTSLNNMASLEALEKNRDQYKVKFSQLKLRKRSEVVQNGVTCQNRGREKCTSAAYQQLSMPLCKHHFIKYIKGMLRREFRNLYRHPDIAFGTLDSTGTGKVNMETFGKSQVWDRIQETLRKQVQKKKFDVGENEEDGPNANLHLFNKKDIQQFMIIANIFDVKNGNTMTYPVFKKQFFPNLCHALADEREGDDMDSEKGAKEKKDRAELNINPEDQPKLVADRVRKIELLVRSKLALNYDSVRKAFLQLDSDHDGFVTIEDFLRIFGDNKGFNYIDFKKLIESRAQIGNNKSGKISYEEFSAWVGNSIHVSQGFYFRHDSHINPQYEINKQKIDKQKVFTDQCRSELTSIDLKQKVIRKIVDQWKTIRKAFSDMNKDTSATGFISKNELKFYLNHWGLEMTEKQFNEVYNLMDIDQDGVISYSDFNQSVGLEITPQEGLYFRQDKSSKNKQKKCLQFQCWSSTCGNGNYCTLHNKMYQDKVEKFYLNLLNNADKEKWREFTNKIREEASAEDNHQLIDLVTFEKILNDYLNLKISETQRELLFNTSGRIYKGQKTINIGLIYSYRHIQEMRDIYKDINLTDNEEDNPVDTSGYTGIPHRLTEKNMRHMKILTDAQFLQIFKDDNRLGTIMKMVYNIDKDHNGYITTTELDDILKITYPKELMNVNLKSTLRPFCSSSNKVLLDYRYFRDFIKDFLEGKKNVDPSSAIDPSTGKVKSWEHVPGQNQKSYNTLSTTQKEASFRTNKSRQNLERVQKQQQESKLQKEQRRQDWKDLISQNASKRNDESKQNTTESKRSKTTWKQHRTQQIGGKTARDPTPEELRAKLIVPDITQQDVFKVISRDNSQTHHTQRSHTQSNIKIQNQYPNREWMKGINSQLGLKSMNVIKAGAISSKSKILGNAQMEGMGTYFYQNNVADETMPELPNTNNRTMSNQNARSHRAFLKATQLPQKDRGLNMDHYGFVNTEQRAIRKLAAELQRENIIEQTQKSQRKLGSRKLSDINLDNTNTAKIDTFVDNGIVPPIKSNQQGSLTIKSKKYYSKFQGSDEKLAHKLYGTTGEYSVLAAQGADQTQRLQKNQNIKEKLSYSWKRIYRYLSQNDAQNLGQISTKIFQQSLSQNNTFLSREELDFIYRQFKDPATRLLDYNRMSQSIMGIKTGSSQFEQLDRMRKTHSTLNKIRQDMQKVYVDQLSGEHEL